MTDLSVTWPDDPTCLLCREPMEPDYSHTQQGHRECLLRSALGGIGHHKDHAYWCVKMGDPDAGMSFRDSARAVMKLLDEIGPERLAKSATTFD